MRASRTRFLRRTRAEHVGHRLLPCKIIRKDICKAAGIAHDCSGKVDGVTYVNNPFPRGYGIIWKRHTAIFERNSQNVNFLRIAVQSIVSILVLSRVTFYVAY